MNIDFPASWPTTEAEALSVQERLRARVKTSGSVSLSGVGTVAGLDVAYAKDSDELAGAVVVLDARTLEPIEQKATEGVARFPYIPGLLAFREIPALVDALRQLRTVPDVLVCDGYGIAHPRRFGLACHLGALTGLPSIGVAKTAFIGRYAEPAAHRGAFSPLVDGDEVIGRVLRTRDGVKPVFVSIGSGISLDAATELVLALTPRYRLPETTRAADHLSRITLAAYTCAQPGRSL